MSKALSYLNQPVLGTKGTSTPKSFTSSITQMANVQSNLEIYDRKAEKIQAEELKKQMQLHE